MAFNKLTLLSLLVIVGSSIATFPRGRIYPFPITNLLTCHQLTRNGDLLVEEPPILPLVPAPGGEVWLPANSGFRIPRFPTNRRSNAMEETLEEMLSNFLGDDFNPELQSTVRPTRDAPRACDLIGAIEGSAGQLLRFNEEEVWDADRTQRTLVDDLIENVPGSSRADLFETLGLTIRRLENINRQPDLCDIHVGVCPLITAWTDLGFTYFPRFFAAGLCSGKNCSIPRGQTCDPDIRNDRITSIIALRWDCCFNPDPFLFIAPKWECGWRRVRVPILCDCRCGCGPNIDLSPLDPALVSP